MRLLLCIDASDVADTTLDAFFDANSFDASEAAAIRAAVDAGDTYQGGGGASPLWTIGTPAAIGDWLAKRDAA